ncbi:MAG: hypothetical protein HC945_04600 [Nitrosarchaeum sp.]|nr:hypothetical protein [Nitrosarchaeum sp.]
MNRTRDSWRTRNESSIRAQAAMEFLMTYGWAFLILIAIASILAYTGIINPGNIFGNRAYLESGMHLQEYKFDDDTVKLSVMNTMNQPINSINITVNSTAGSDVACHGSTTLASLQPNVPSTVFNACTVTGTIPEVARLSADITVSYRKDSELVSHTLEGRLFLKRNT